MALELSKEAHKAALASLERYCRENLDEEVGNVAAVAMLRFIVAELGPTFYNMGVADAQTRMQARLAEVDGELHEIEFQYWRDQDRRRRPGS